MHLFLLPSIVLGGSCPLLPSITPTPPEAPAPEPTPATTAATKPSATAATKPSATARPPPKPSTTTRRKPAPAPASTAPTTPTPPSATAAAPLRPLRLGQKALQRQQLLGVDEEFIARRIRRGHHALGHLDGEVHRVDRPKHLLHLSHLGLVLEENRRVEVWNHGIRQLADGFALAWVLENAGLYHLCGGTLVIPVKTPTSSASAPAEPTAIPCGS